MQRSKQIREKLGLSQEALAIYLGVTRSQIAMSERGERSLPTKAFIKLAQLEKRLELKLYLLREKKDNYGAVALLIKEFAQAKLEKNFQSHKISPTSYWHTRLLFKSPKTQISPLPAPVAGFLLLPTQIHPY